MRPLLELEGAVEFVVVRDGDAIYRRALNRRDDAIVSAAAIFGDEGMGMQIDLPRNR